jgi:hypothetical protein
MTGATLQGPASLLYHHEDLRRQLGRLATEAGPLGAAAAEVERLLLPHDEREEALALPLLGLLPAIVNGGVAAGVEQAAVLADRLRLELPRLLEEHIAIVGGLQTLLEMADEIGRPDISQVAMQLIHHAELEEEVLHPAAILAGASCAAWWPPSRALATERRQ